MADAAVAANGGGEGEQQQQQQSWFDMLKGMIWRFMIMYFIMNLFKGGGDKSAAPNSSSNGQVATTNSLKAKNLFDRGTVMDMYLYISEDERMRWKRDDKLAVGTISRSLWSCRLIARQQKDGVILSPGCLCSY